MARRAEDLGRVSTDPRWSRCVVDSGGRTWTDDYANVTAALHFD